MTEHFTARSRTTIVLVAGAAAAWAVTVDRMRGMDDGPGTDLGGLGWYLGIWVTMTAAMMLPSAAPGGAARSPDAARLLCFSRSDISRSGRATASWRTASSASSTSVDPGWLAWDRSGPLAAGCAIAAAGLYELTPVEAAEPSPLPQRSAAATRCRSGLTHGFACVGCSGALMAVLFVLGAMSLVLDGGHRRRDLRGEGSAARSAARARLRGRARRPRNLGRRVSGERSRADGAGRVSFDGDG